MVEANENEYDFLLPNSEKPKFSLEMRRKVWLQIGLMYLNIKVHVLI